MAQFETGQRLEDQLEEENVEEPEATQLEPQTYSGAKKKYYLRFLDMDLVSAFLCS